MPSIKTEDLGGRDAYQLLTSIVTPRPIAWVSTINAQGISNLAPYSFFNAVAGSPPTIMFSVGQRRESPKDTLRNVETTGEFVVNMVDEAHANAMNQTSATLAYGESEIEAVGLATLPSEIVKPPRLAEVPVAMEARVTQLVPVTGTPSVMVLGQVVRFHIAEGLLMDDGRVDTAQMRLIGRLGGRGYMRAGEIFEMQRP